MLRVAWLMVSYKALAYVSHHVEGSLAHGLAANLCACHGEHVLELHVNVFVDLVQVVCRKHLLRRSNRHADLYFGVARVHLSSFLLFSSHIYHTYLVHAFTISLVHNSCFGTGYSPTHSR